MRHLRARSLLSALPDGLLSADREEEVRAHVARCSLCERALRQLDLSDDLVRRLPTDLVPERWTPPAVSRLEAAAGIFRWSPQDRLALRTAIATAAVCGILFMVTVGPWGFPRPEPRTPTGYLASAEREATLVVAAFEPRAEVVTN